MTEDKERHSIMVPIGDLDEADDGTEAIDQLAHELATIQQTAKKIAIIGSRNLPITHQQIIETLAYALVIQGNTIITSGGSSGTNAAAIRGAMKAEPSKLKVILPQTIGQQPSDVQDQLIGIPNIVEHPDRAMMTLADASRICNREIIDDCQQMICFLSHTSGTLHKAVAYAEESHKVVTVFYLD
jgi:predicted Rossmann-fold nucleotide-binding protein